VNETVTRTDPRRKSAAAALLAIGAVVVALFLLAALHVLSPEYSPAWRMISEYANGHYAWVLSLMFVAYSVSFLALAFALRSKVQGRSGRIGLAALILAGCGAASAAVFDVNQVALHELAGAVGIVALPVAAALISRSLVRLPEWSGARRRLLWSAHLTWISVVLWVASFVLTVVTFQIALGALPSAPPKEVPAGVIAVVGWTNRLLVLSAWAWVVVVAWQGLRMVFPSHSPANVTSDGSRAVPAMDVPNAGTGVGRGQDSSLVQGSR
jgi:uncharacterized protein DUF998